MKVCLVADESDVIRKVARHIVEANGYVCVEASSAGEALARVRDDMPDAILIDSDFADQPGHDVIRATRACDGGDLSLIICTMTQNKLEDIQQVLEAGADDIILKPLEKPELDQKLNLVRAS